MSAILPFKCFSCILLKFVLHVADKQFSDKFNGRNDRGLLFECALVLNFYRMIYENCISLYIAMY